MSGTTLDVSVVICAYTEERWDDLVAAVESIQQQSIPPREIIVVVDNNHRLLDRVRKYIPGVTTIENSKPQGLSGAKNSGLAIRRNSGAGLVSTAMPLLRGLPGFRCRWDS